MSFRDFLRRRPERRRSPRFEGEDLVAFYWTGAVPDPRKVYQIGVYGAHIIAPDSFYPGTILQIVLEDRAAHGEDGSAKPHICVCAKALRNVKNGFCVTFLFADVAERRSLFRFLTALTRKAPNGAKTTDGTNGREEIKRPESGNGSGEESSEVSASGSSEGFGDGGEGLSEVAGEGSRDNSGGGSGTDGASGKGVRLLKREAR